MKFEHLQGSIVAMVTPFRQDGSVNFDMLTELLERQIAAGTDGILTLGTTGWLMDHNLRIRECKSLSFSSTGEKE